MAYTKKQTEQVKRILDVEEEMLALQKYVRPKSQVLNGLNWHWLETFAKLNLKKGMVVLDLPCGQGGVSIPLAQKYQVQVIGYDIVPVYVKFANELAKRKKVSKLCKFKRRDIVDVAKKENICDVLLWIAPPHIFGKAKSTIMALRRLVKNNGLIIIGDAYLWPSIKSKGEAKDYESLKKTHQGYAAFGDEILSFQDFKGTKWKSDYVYTKKMHQDAMRKAKKPSEKKILQRFIESLSEKEKQDRKNFGIGIWVIKINKN